MSFKNTLLLLITYLSACNSKTKETEKQKTPIKNDFYQQSDSLAILDTLMKHENYHHFETNFKELGCDLSSFLYQGVLNKQNFGIKTNCFDGTIVVYMKKNEKNGKL